jgi:hypothetical protein
MQKYIILISIVFLLTGCFDDPLAMTERARIRADAAIAVAQAERDAAIGAAQAEASKSKAWATVMPIIVAIAGATIVIVTVVWWQGKIYHTRAIQASSYAENVHQITAYSEQDLVRYARRLGGRLAIDNNGYKIYLPGGQVQRLLPVKED